MRCRVGMIDIVAVPPTVMIVFIVSVIATVTVPATTPTVTVAVRRV